MTRTQRQAETHRKGEACIEVHDSSGRPCAGVPVWVEQRTHAFPLSCRAPSPEGLTDANRRRWQDRATDVFNAILPPGSPPSANGSARYDVPTAVNLGRVRFELDRLTAGGGPVAVHVRGTAVGLGGEGQDAAADAARESASAERITSLYTLCFAHPSVATICWEGLWDGEPGVAGAGLVRLDFRPRLAYRFLHVLIDSVWHTRAQGRTAADGCFRFRGFYGDYHISVWRSVEETATGFLEHRRERAGRCIVTLPPAAPDE